MTDAEKKFPFGSLAVLFACLLGVAVLILSLIAYDHERRMPAEIPPAYLLQQVRDNTHEVHKLEIRVRELENKARP